MADTPEARVKEAVDNLLSAYGAAQHKPVQNGMGQPWLDYHVCHKGLYAAIEAKGTERDRPTPRQIRTMRKVKEAGGCVFLIRSTSGADFAQLHAWLLAPCAGFISKTAQAFITGYVDLPDAAEQKGEPIDFSND